MTQYLLRKLGVLLATLFCVVTLTFVLIRLIPGDPFGDEKALPKTTLQSMHRHYGLDRPWHEQYLRYLNGLISFDFGPSLRYSGVTVGHILKKHFPVSALLGISALSVSLPLGICLGAVAAVYKSRWQDRALMAFAVIGVSLPSYVLATFLQYQLAFKFDLFPIAGFDTAWHLVLPCASLATLPTAFIARLVRSSFLETLGQDYVMTARAKGIPESRVLIQHVLKNSLIPVVGYLGQLTVGVVMGSFVLEEIFSIPGLGRTFVTSVSNRDYSVIMGITVFYGAILVIMTFLSDLLHALLDPRISKGGILCDPSSS